MNLDPFTRLRPHRVPDPYNPDALLDDWDNADEIDLEGYFEPNSSTEQLDPVRNKVVTVYLLVLWDPDADVRRGDRIVQGDQTWRVHGFPPAPKNPFTGWQPYKYVRIVEEVG